jgi:hypothetical protein
LFPFSITACKFFLLPVYCSGRRNNHISLHRMGSPES